MEVIKNSRISDEVCLSARKFSDALHKILTSETEQNVVNSPFSLHIILSLLSHGAREATARDLKAGLFHPETNLHSGFKYLISTLNDAEVEFRVANTIFIQEELQLLPDFISTSEEVFHAAVTHVNFKEAAKAIGEINAWIAEKTRNKIHDIIASDDINEDTRVVMANAVYFKSIWLHKFDSQLTKNQDFRNINNKVQHVPMMFKSANFSNGILKDFNARVLEIPYKNEDFDMVIVLPNDVDGLRSLEQNFNWDTVLNSHLRTSKVELFLPKFKLKVKINLKETLEKMGMGNIFTNGADFSDISKTPLKVSQVVHKVFIEVDEEGSEATAATGVQMRLRRCIAIEEPDVFRVDRPFLLAIRYKPSNIPLFVGSVRNVGESAEKDEL